MARDFTNNVANYLAAVGPDDVITANGAYSMAAWIRPDAVAGDFTVLSKFNGSFGPILRLNASKIAFFTVDSGAAGQEAIGATNLSTGVWQHVGGAWDGSSAMRVMLGGVQDGTDTMTTQHTTQDADWNIGRRPSATNPFDGLIAEVALWNVYLSDGEWLALGKGVPPSRIRPTAIQGYWPIFGAHSAEIDISGRGNHATINGTLNTADHAPVGRLAAGR